MALVAYAGLMLAAHLGAWRELHYNDFGKFFYSVRLWESGASMYGPSPATEIPVGFGRTAQFWNMNPPHFHLIVWPLTFLSMDAAAMLWTAINLIAFAWALSIVAIRVGWPASGPAPRVTFVLVAASAPVLAWALTGQLTGLLTAAATATWVACRDRRWQRAGIITGVLCSVKPFLAPLWLWLVFERHWPAAAAATGAALVCFGAGLIAFGVDAYVAWLSALGGVDWAGAAMNASVYGLVGRMWTPGVSSPSSLALLVSGILAVAVLGYGLYSAVRTADIDCSLLVVLATALLASPLGWVYYVPILIGPAVALGPRLRPRWLLVAVVICLMPPPIAISLQSTRLATSTIGSAYTWALVGLWVAGLRLGRATWTGGHAEGRGSTAPA